jgi:hypothetical protein
LLLAAIVPTSADGQGRGGAQPQSVCAQDAPAVFHACSKEAAKSYTPPRTADGQPDLSGYWRHRTPGHEDLEEHPRTPEDSGGPAAVVDPADGKVPMQAWADALRKENAAKYIDQNIQCFQSGALRHLYQGSYQFLQTKDQIVFLSEETRAYRIVSLDARPHLGKDIQLWQGSSRGRWEGNTLVVETRNHNGMPWLDQRARFYTDEAVTVERFTPIDANTIHYEATLTDLNVYTRPFTIAFPLRRNTTQGFQIMEESCFEGEGNVKHLNNLGLGKFPGITAKQARELKAAFERRTSR